MDADRSPAAAKPFPQLKASLRGRCDIRRRDETGVHRTLLNAEGLWAAIFPDFSDRTRNSGSSSDAATSWPLILPGEVSFRSTRPTLPPPLDCQATRSPALSCFAMLSSEENSLPNSQEAGRLQK